MRDEATMPSHCRRDTWGWVPRAPVYAEATKTSSEMSKVRLIMWRPKTSNLVGIKKNCKELTP
jgi:hypothetical protein